MMRKMEAATRKIVRALWTPWLLGWTEHHEGANSSATFQHILCIGMATILLAPSAASVPARAADHIPARLHAVLSFFRLDAFDSSGDDFPYASLDEQTESYSHARPPACGRTRLLPSNLSLNPARNLGQPLCGQQAQVGSPRKTMQAKHGMC